MLSLYFAEQPTYQMRDKSGSVTQRRYCLKGARITGGFACLPTKTFHNAPESFVRLRLSAFASPLQVQSQPSIRVLPPTKASSMNMFSIITSSDMNTSHTEIVSVSTIIVVSDGLHTSVKNITPGFPTEATGEDCNNISMSDHFIMETTSVPQALQSEPFVGRLLVARDEYDRRLARVNVRDPQTLDLWEERQAIDDELAELVRIYTTNQELEHNVFPGRAYSNFEQRQPDCHIGENSSVFDSFDTAGDAILAQEESKKVKKASNERIGQSKPPGSPLNSRGTDSRQVQVRTSCDDHC